MDQDYAILSLHKDVHIIVKVAIILESWDENGGYLEDIDHIIADIMKNPLLDGITLSGGEPFLQCQPLIALLNQIKKQTHLHIMIYSGYTYEEIFTLGKEAIELLCLCDTLVDGRFVLS